MSNQKYKSLDIEISSVCNMTCTNCEYSETSKSKKGFMNLKVFTSILNMAKEYGINYVHLVGLGEQTLHPEFEKFAHLLISYKKSFNIGITTNGTKIKKYYTLLNSFDSVTISIDASNQLTYERVRPGHDFNTLLNDINLIKSIKKRASFIINNKNILEVKPFIELTCAKGFDEIYFEVANEPWSKQNNQELIKKSKDLFKNIHHNTIKITFKEPLKNNICDYITKTIKISYDNKLALCPFINDCSDYAHINDILKIKGIQELEVIKDNYFECIECNHFQKNKNY